MSPRPLLETQGLTRYFGGLAAVDHVDLTVSEGEIVGLIGPNGAGKTTCFNLLSGFIRPTAGTIRFDGDDITRLRPHQVVRRGLVRTFQLTTLFHADQLARNLPHGHQRALGIAMAMAARPRLLLLDEPVTGMNLDESGRVMALVKTIRDRGTTILLVEHNMKAVMGTCERIVVLNFGQKLAEGTPADVSANASVIEAYLGAGLAHA
ncbi:MAG: ABC transporter ATP-binding protein [Candidatus Rokuibacteriota bacterium]|nr:MAG: ABC transporter ATP-binding protein [Candidatus Rokubacteria bacterium]